jgi:hypothetical protein
MIEAAKSKRVLRGLAELAASPSTGKIRIERAGCPLRRQQPLDRDPAERATWQKS